MKILSLDTSCDESCASIIDTTRWKLLADVVHTHVADMRPYGGIVPEMASRAHLSGLPLAVHEALNLAGLKISDLDWITVTNRPGLIGALLVGVTFGKGLAFAAGLPFSVMNHIEGHLYSPSLATLEESTPLPPFPWVTLVVSGGHTELYVVEDWLKHRWIGGTRDDAAGEAFDKIGKLLGLEYPAGPVIDKWVREEAEPQDRDQFLFPRAYPGEDQFSFSGLKTAVHLALQKLKNPTPKIKLQIAASAQEAILDALVHQTVRAKERLGARTILVTGGVACNSRLREKLPDAFFPKPRHCTDNAAMIAVLSGLYERSGKLTADSWNVTAIPHLE